MTSNFIKCSRGPKTNFTLLKENLNFWIMKFINNVKENDDNGCWEWQAASNDSGYGVLYVYNYENKKKFEYVHRLSYFLYYGEIPINKIVDHKCKNTICVNPLHLQLLVHEKNCAQGRKGKWKKYCGTCGDEKIIKKYNNKLRNVCVQCNRKSSQKYKNKIKGGGGMVTH